MAKWWWRQSGQAVSEIRDLTIQQARQGGGTGRLTTGFSVKYKILDVWGTYDAISKSYDDNKIIVKYFCIMKTADS